MFKDRYGLELSTTSAEAAEHYIDGVDRILAGDAGVETTLEAAIAADPGFSMPHAALARAHLNCGRGKLARSAAEVASQLVSSASRREQQHVAIISNIVSGHVPRSLELTHEHLADFPRDAFALDPACGVFGSMGFSGRIDREAEQLALLEPLATHYGDDWWFLTVFAFALLETGEWTRARAMVERALELRPTSSHGARTLAHALFESGSDDEALQFMTGWMQTSDRDSLLHCQLWWHQALLLLVTGDYDQALEALKDNCLPGATDSPSINVFTDSVSFLWRAELAGVPRHRDIWEILQRYYEEEFRGPMVFVDAHVGLVYAALGETEKLDACIAELKELGEAGRLPAGSTAATLSQGYKAFADKQWDKVIAIFEPTMDQLVRIGGSRTQRDMQANTLLAAYVNDGRFEDAAAFIENDDDRKPSRPVAGLAT